MESPTILLGTGTADESAVHHFRLVLDRTEETKEDGVIDKIYAVEGEKVSQGDLLVSFAKEEE